MEVGFAGTKRRRDSTLLFPLDRYLGQDLKHSTPIRMLLFFLDVDECKDIAFICGLDGICINKNGSYDCVCPEGQKPNPRDKRCEGR